MAFTSDEIEAAEQRLLQNVLRVREGNTWVEYGSPAALRQAINYAKSQLSAASRPSGTHYIKVGKGY